jgi:hypothetical protein
MSKPVWSVDDLFKDFFKDGFKDVLKHDDKSQYGDHG